MKQNFVTKWIAAGMAACMLLGSMVQGGLSTEAADTAEKPMLTIACLSDLHNQESLIEGDVEDVKLRGVVDATLKAIKEEEEIDMMILCGDYTSDSTGKLAENPRDHRRVHEKRLSGRRRRASCAVGKRKS